MNNRLLFGFLVITLLSCGGGAKDSVELAHEQNLNSAIDERISEFMTEAADAHMMALEQAKLASTKATSPKIREFGQWIADEQTRLLQNLRMLAAQKNVTLPQTLNNRNAKDLEELQQEENFDEAVMTRMRKHYKDAVDNFEDGEDVRDDDVQLFAKSNLPVVESHLARIEQVQEEIARANPVSEETD